MIAALFQKLWQTTMQMKTKILSTGPEEPEQNIAPQNDVISLSDPQTDFIYSKKLILSTFQSYKPYTEVRDTAIKSFVEQYHLKRFRREHA